MRSSSRPHWTAVCAHTQLACCQKRASPHEVQAAEDDQSTGSIYGNDVQQSRSRGCSALGVNKEENHDCHGR